MTGTHTNDLQIAERCRKLGISERFRPRLEVHWYRRGENALKDRRAELCKVAQTRLVEEGLGTDAARQLLEELPAAEASMPPLEVTELEQHLGGRRGRHLRGVGE